MYDKITNEELRERTKQIPSGERDEEEMLAMDRTHIQRSDQKHCKTGTVLEPAGKEEYRKT